MQLKCKDFADLSDFQLIKGERNLRLRYDTCYKTRFLRAEYLSVSDGDRLMKMARFWICLLSTIVSGCASDDFGRVLDKERINYASGSVLGIRMTSKDQRVLQPVFSHALSGGANGERFEWRGPSAFGWVKAKKTSLGNLRPDENDLLEYPQGLDISSRLETELGLFALTRNANVRNGPSTDHRVLAQLPSGTAIDAIGRVPEGDWILASVDGLVVGYVFAGLMIKAPGTELELAGGPTRTPLHCRAFEQRISFQQRSDRWEGVACLKDGVWVLNQRTSNAPVLLN